MRDGVSLVAHEVVEAVRAVGVDEAISDPGTSTYTVVSLAINGPTLLVSSLPLVDVANNLESGFGAILIDLATLNSLQVAFS